jgi:hypothetical protein
LKLILYYRFFSGSRVLFIGNRGSIGVLGTKENNIVVIYKIKHMIFLCNLISRFTLVNIFQANYHFTHRKKQLYFHITAGQYCAP